MHDLAKRLENVVIFAAVVIGVFYVFIFCCACGMASVRQGPDACTEWTNAKAAGWEEPDSYCE